MIRLYIIPHVREEQMENERIKIKLWENGTPYFDPEKGQEEPYLEPHMVKGSRICVIVCPGGGYHNLVEHERTCIADALNQNGISAFILNYRVAPYDYRAIVSDGSRAVRLTRYLAPEYGYDPDKIAVIGFSAGGHIASVMSTRYDKGDSLSADPVERMSSRPDTGILCYAVISLVDHAHQGSAKVFAGSGTPDDFLKKTLLNYYSGELSVQDDNPPIFLWHTAEDAVVPVENALHMALALREKKIPFELHVFPYGRHGRSLASGDRYAPLVGSWVRLLVDNLNFVLCGKAEVK